MGNGQGPLRAGAAVAKDPVCGMTVDPARAAATRVHAGATYHFCSVGCAKRFEADPAAFLPKAGGLPMSSGAMTNQADHEMPAMEDKGWRAYTPLLVVFLLLLAAVAALAWHDLHTGVRTTSWTKAVTRFMAGFFLVFAGFKLMDLRGFADGYSTYDLLASRVRPYAFAYPFVELAFGLLMLAGVGGVALLWAEVAVMAFSGVGVAIKLARKEPFQCACLGTFLKVPLTKVTLVEDFGMAALAVVLLLLR